MPTAIPAMRGRFGTTDFYVATMSAGFLADTVVMHKSVCGPAGLSAEERLHRRLNYKAVRKHLAPYLANDSDRFFGGFVLDVYNGEDMQFEPIEALVANFELPYGIASTSIGFLCFQGCEVLVPLDGQHRLAAMKFAISGKDEKGKDIVGLTPNMDVAKDSCTVILVRHDPKKARKIFSKVNRYAKATSKAYNLITADDDIVAVLTREEVADKIIHGRLVNCDSNALTANSPFFSTLATLYEATALILEETFGKIDRTALPSHADQNLYRQTVREHWQSLCEGVTLFQSALHDPSEAGDDKRREIRADFLLGKPIAQLALIDAVLRLRTEAEDGTRLSWQAVIERVNLVDWRSDNPIWQGVLMTGNKIVAGRQAARFAGRFIAYLLGESLTQKELDVLREQYVGRPGNEKKSLPPALA
jgi:DNA sulfur modification protein DndB